MESEMSSIPELGRAKERQTLVQWKRQVTSQQQINLEELNYTRFPLA